MTVNLARPARRLFTAAALASLCAQAALAQSWSEPRYSPEVGSRWRIESRLDREKTQGPRGSTSLHAESVAAMAVDAKLADGFRISYVTRKISFTGNEPQAPAMNAAFGAMQGVIVHARTDAAGRPVMVENIEEVRSVMREVIDRMIASLGDKPKVAAMIKQLMQQMLIADGARAAKAYLGNLPQLADAQDIGLQPGEVRRVKQDMKSPFGGPPIKATVTTRLIAWDDAAGTARILRKRELEPGTVKAATLDLMRRAIAARGKPLPPKMVEMFNKLDLQTDSETTIDVKNGMTRRLQKHSTLTVTIFDKTVREQQTELVTVTRLPQ